MDFGKGQFKAKIINTGRIVDDMAGFSEEAWDFVMYLREKDSLVDLGGSYGIPVSREALDEKTKTQVAALEKQNQETPDDPALGPKDSIEDSDINTYFALVEHIDRKIANYPAIMNVVKEEAAAYFADQRSVDDVASIIQNRVMLILQESQ